MASASVGGNDEDLIKVVVRVRKLINREKKQSKAFTVQDSQEVVQKDTDKTWRFDRVYSQVDDNQAVYAGTAQNIIESAVMGYNSTIFAYGQTSSGKTHTMMGSDQEPGIIPLAVEHLFLAIEDTPDRSFLMQVSYMEIYNETILDLLCEPSKRKQSNLKIRENGTGNVFVEGLEEAVVSSPEEVISLMKEGEKNRHYEQTNMNARSSRSHTIFRIILESKLRTEDDTADDGSVIQVSHLNLVDLAGSEKAGQTGARGAVLKEGCNINNSLMILGQVIQKLSSGSSSYVNFRDSKLTRILQNSLGGNARTAIIATVTPAAMSVEQTISTLRFAHTAKTIKQHAEVNEVMDDRARINRMESEMEELQKQLEEQRKINGSGMMKEMQEKLEKEKEEKESLIKKLEEFRREKMVVSSQPSTGGTPGKSRPPGMRKSMRQSFLFRPPLSPSFRRSPSPLLSPNFRPSPSQRLAYDERPLRITVDDDDEEEVFNFVQKESGDKGDGEVKRLETKVEELQNRLEEANIEIKEKNKKIDKESGDIGDGEVVKRLEMKVEELENRLEEANIVIKEKTNKVDKLQSSLLLNEEKAKEERLKLEIDLKQKHKVEINTLTKTLSEEIHSNMPAVEAKIKQVVSEKNEELVELCNQYKTELNRLQITKKGVCPVCKKKFKGEAGVKGHLRLSLCGESELNATTSGLDSLLLSPSSG